ncbi:phytase [Sphingobacterium deserti]|uniref:Phytase n=1 Tax=Sphingobacterium deserti TaxID=1229276 RepID=A0A0B8T6U9_9SPHI|nr:phytase [Sphingobacterium deserti]KGE13954.1 phytase [Sphingobacterium deserti]
MMNTKLAIFAALAYASSLASCSSGLAPVAKDAVVPTIVTEQTEFDTDDPAIWIHPTDPSKSLIVGTDKEVGGGLYVYDLNGKIVNKVTGLERPNNVDIAYGLEVNGKKVDIAIATERKAHKIRVFSLPDLTPMDNGGIPIFEGETGEGEREGMGISIYTKKDSINSTIYAIVGRKTGPSGSYLWQYKIHAGADGVVKGEVVRKFGTYSGKKEIEAIAVDNELGYVYYSDETVGVRKYHADPDRKDDQEIAFFAQNDVKSDHEGIAIYKTGDSTGYILLSNQQNNSFVVYHREGANGNRNLHEKLADIPVSAVECDGAEATSINLGGKFPKGMLVAMSNGKVFHYYDWNLIQERIDRAEGR